MPSAKLSSGVPNIIPVSRHSCTSKEYSLEISRWYRDTRGSSCFVGGSTKHSSGMNLISTHATATVGMELQGAGKVLCWPQALRHWPPCAIPMYLTMKIDIPAVNNFWRGFLCNHLLPVVQCQCYTTVKKWLGVWGHKTLYNTWLFSRIRENLVSNN